MPVLARSLLPVLHVLGGIVILFAFTMLVPLAFAYFGTDRALRDYDVSFFITLASGSIMLLASRPFKRELLPRDGFLLLTLIWTVLPAFAALPFLLNLPGLSFTDAYFEAMSGLTTTGATVLNNLDSLPQSINLWRCTLHWIGGIGIIVLAVAVLPLLGVGGMQLYKAETPGPVKDEKLTPRITETAKSLWVVYLVLTVIGIAALKMCGMSWLDAICHGFSALGLGGFSTHDASIAYFH